jgi:NOL1/NOP2/fmu family ribosome biogenesis protein
MAASLTDRENVLNVLAHSRLANVPQPIITENQIRRIMRGEDVRPTAKQRQSSMQIECEESWFYQKCVKTL